MDESPDQLAAVIGHEIGHLQDDHVRGPMGNARAQNALQRVVAVFLRQSDIEFDEEIMAPLGLGLRYGVVFPYGRQHEFEADRLGLSLMREPSSSLFTTLLLGAERAACLGTKGGKRNFAAHRMNDRDAQRTPLG
ncbi:M48 family metalloprotease [Roseicyclus sp. F158]|uniref:M48 family metalloprotease n=1 Tax=Tropicimonas omnivorans TaxID=3075590 RepID=A0ABU3DKY3_9RHOB|nr:M48 family metalloprotease [Roseicyclus sp. F158]MDT0684194.1 M48 family metalloprotease [Roseicyclus sp. F158]